MVGFSTTAIFNIQTVPYAFSDSVVFASRCNIMHLSVINTFVVRPSTALQAMHAACSSGCCGALKTRCCISLVLLIYNNNNYYYYYYSGT